MIQSATLLSATRWALALAFIMVAAYARHRPQHRPVAALLAWSAICDVGLRQLGAYVVAAQEGMRAAGMDPLVEPLTGWGRFAGHTYQIVWSSWSPAVALVAVYAFAPRVRWVRWIPGIAWGVTALVLVLGYHHIRGHAARPVYLTLDAACEAFAVAMAVGWAVTRRSPRLPHLAVGAIVLLQLAHFRAWYDRVWSEHDLALVALLVLCSFLAILYGGAICWSYKSRSA